MQPINTKEMAIFQKILKIKLSKKQKTKFKSQSSYR